MSTSAPIPPDDQPTRVTPPAGGPGGPGAPGAGESRTFSAGVLAAVAVAVLVVAGLGGYFIGHSSGDDSGQKSGYDKGFAAGQEQVHAQYRPGQQAYETIYAKGKAAGVAEGTKQGQATGEAEGQRAGEAQGQRVGFEQGQRQGVSTGESEGVRQGAAAVLGGFTSWTDGAFYIVTVGSSQTEGVPYTITSRTQLQPDTDYKLCQDGGSQQVCQSAATSDTSTGAADDGGATPSE